MTISNRAPPQTDESRRGRPCGDPRRPTGVFWSHEYGRGRALSGAIASPLRCAALATVVAAILLVQPSFAKELKIATSAPDGTAWMKLLRQAGTDVAKATDGRVKLKFYPGGTQGDDRDVMRKMRIGQVHGGSVRTGVFGRTYSDIQLYNLPMVFRSMDEVDAARRVLGCGPDQGARGCRLHGLRHRRARYGLRHEHARGTLAGGCPSAEGLGAEGRHPGDSPARKPSESSRSR